MAIDFPNTPSVNQLFSVGDRTWQWNGTAWVAASSAAYATLTGVQTLTNKTLTLPTIGGTGATFNGSTSGTTVLKASAAAGTTTITMPATTGTMALISDITTVNDGGLTVSIGGTAASSGTALAWGTATGFTANDATATTTYDLRVGPALTALATIMSGASTGVLNKSAADTYTLVSVMTNPMTTLGDIIYTNATPAPARLAGNTTTTKQFLSQTGTGTVSAAPAWGALAVADIPTLSSAKISDITLGGALTFSGAFTTTFTVTANTSVTLPTSGTLVNSAVTTLSSLASVGTITAGTWNGTAIAYNYGGTGLTSYAKGDIIYASAANTLAKLAVPATNGYLLTYNSTTGLPQWSAPSGGTGTVTQIVAGTGLTGGTITTSGTIAIDTATVATLTGTQTLTNKTFTDSSTYFQDNTDNTKKMLFELSGISTATTRTLTVPNSNGTIALVADLNSYALLAGATFTGGIDVSSGAITTAAQGINPSTTGGVYLGNAGKIHATVNGGTVMQLNRNTSDGEIIGLYQAATLEGSVSVSGTTVTYGSFAGTHWSQFENNERPDILPGTILENTGEMCEWAGEENEQLTRVKISDTEDSSAVYGVFMRYDDDDEDYPNDIYVLALGAWMIRVDANEIVFVGDLLSSKGNGCAKVQDDDIIRSKTIGKVTSSIPVTIYEDGSRLIPCVLYCG